MITREQLLDELKTAVEPEKQLHKIAQRENLPVHVLRKMVERPELVVVEEPEKRPVAEKRPQNQPHIMWSERELKYAVNAFRRGDSLSRIAFELELGRDTVRRKLMNELGDEYQKIARENCARARQHKKIELTENDIERLKDCWVNGVAKNKICGYFGLSYNNLQRFLAENPDILRLRRGRR